MFIAVYTPFLSETDLFRIWARGCPCHAELLRKHVPVECFWKGRRLKDAPERVRQYQHWLSETARKLKLSDCEDDQGLFLEYGASLRLAFAETGERFGWVAEPPYMFCNICDPEWAAVWIDSVSSVEVARRQRQVVQLNDRFGPDSCSARRGHFLA